MTLFYSLKHLSIQPHKHIEIITTGPQKLCSHYYLKWQKLSFVILHEYCTKLGRSQTNPVSLHWISPFCVKLWTWSHKHGRYVCSPYWWGSRQPVAPESRVRRGGSPQGELQALLEAELQYSGCCNTFLTAVTMTRAKSLKRLCAFFFPKINAQESKQRTFKL